jgi:hypothetical protein
VRNDWQLTQIEHALCRRETGHVRTDTKVALVGDARLIPTYEGPRWDIYGKLHFWHCGSHVMAVDFDEDRVTDFGYSGYSMTTTRHVSGWLHALQRMPILDVESVCPGYRPFDWTQSYRYNTNPKFRGEGWHEDMFDRYRARIPWVHWIDGMPWFHAQRWDLVQLAVYEDLRRELLGDRMHMWWTGDWDAQGRWVKRFIDDDARRRWEALQKRKQRGQVRLQEVA